MWIRFALGFLLLVASHAFARSLTKTYTPSRVYNELILRPLPHTYISAKDLPDYYDVRNVSGVNYASIVRSQMVPLYCGSCWAMSATSALNDRFKLLRKNAHPDVQLGVQGLLNCAGPAIGTCNGGDALGAYKWINENGISDETCNPYVASGMACTDLDTCRICNDDDTGCTIIYKFPKFYVQEYGYIPSKTMPALDVVTEMMSEIFSRGPIVCSLYTDKVFDAYRGGIMMSRPYGTLDHDVAVSGWGEEVVNGTHVPYWIIRNSFGSWWGEFGFFRLERGVNALGIETSCAWGVPNPF